MYVTSLTFIFIQTFSTRMDFWTVFRWKCRKKSESGFFVAAKFTVGRDLERKKRMPLMAIETQCTVTCDIVPFQTWLMEPSHTPFRCTLAGSRNNKVPCPIALTELMLPKPLSRFRYEGQFAPADYTCERFPEISKMPLTDRRFIGPNGRFPICLFLPVRGFRFVRRISAEHLRLVYSE